MALDAFQACEFVFQFFGTADGQGDGGHDLDKP